MDYESGKKFVEAVLLQECGECRGTTVSTATNKRCQNCSGTGQILNGVGEALIEFLGDYLTEKFAEKEHGHHLR